MMLAGVGTDNPDQRIQEDIPRFINGGQFGGLGVYNFSINLISNLSSLVSFAIILWALSARLTIPGTVDPYTRPAAVVFDRLRHHRNWFDGPDRAASRGPRLRPAALRGEFPFRARTSSRIQRTDRAPFRRERRKSRSSPNASFRSSGTSIPSSMSKRS